MPPKKQTEREDILNKAFEITRSDGIESITARSLHCSTQPIYQAFADMKTLEKEVAKKALRLCCNRCISKQKPCIRI